MSRQDRRKRMGIDPQQRRRPFTRRAVVLSCIISAVALIAVALVAGVVKPDTQPATQLQATSDQPPGTRPDASPGVTLPPAGGLPDYQLGGAYEPAEAVEIVARDRLAEPAPGLYSICYINGFQTQPGEAENWPEELLMQVNGQPLIDPGWPDEVLLNTSSADTRDAITERITPWIKQCARQGFAAVEFDNLDSYTRSQGALTFADNAALATELVQVAHDAGLAAAQKNTAEESAELRRTVGFDFVITEGCLATAECADYAAVYGTRVIDIEYVEDSGSDIARLCDSADAPLSMVLRDRPLSTPGEPGYAFALCDR